jgi:hypothetical protein
MKNVFQLVFGKKHKSTIQLKSTYAKLWIVLKIYEICIKMLPYTFNMCLTIFLLKEPNLKNKSLKFTQMSACFQSFPKF